VARLLAGPGGRISLLTVLDAVPAYVSSYIPPETIAQGRDEARGRLQKLAAAAGVEAEVYLREGPAANQIIEEATALGCDAIVLGSHRPDYRDYFLGSTAARVVRHAPCTVVVERSALEPAAGATA
jgi:universal stress protein F